MVRSVIEAQYVLGAMAFNSCLSRPSCDVILGIGFDDYWNTLKEFYDITRPVADTIFELEKKFKFHFRCS